MKSRFVPVISSPRDAKKDVKYGRGESSIRNAFMNALRMNGGDGVNSYASNSLHQRMVMLKAKPVLVENAREMLISLDFPSHIKVADLGCSSGQNTFLAMSEFVGAVDLLCDEEGRERPEIECCLNDLFENDFNAAFKSVPFFHEELLNANRGSCFVSATPGSFHSRLFPSKSLHFVHSSYSLHWLSKVPEGLENNKKNVYITSSSPTSAYEAYLDQFRKDFSSFLRLRSEEIVPKGRMVLTFIGRNSPDPLYRHCCHFWTLLSESLVDLVSEGLVSETQMESFKMPWYDADEREVREIVEEEGSFEVDGFEAHEYDLCRSEDGNDGGDFRVRRLETGRRKANCIRAVTEPMLVAHFGHGVVERLFAKYAAPHAGCPHETTLNLVVSLTKIV